MSFFRNAYASIQAVLATFPLSTTAAATLIADFLAKYGFDVSVTQLLAIGSAVLVVVGVFVNHSVKKVLSREGA